ncbi:MAG: DEAD/DEAH box helicase, partial [Acidimicrobiales bacterium]
MTEPAHRDPPPRPASIVDDLHPAVSGWFLRRFPGGPTHPQRSAWPPIRAGDDVLVASPTGTGKTLTGFLMAIDSAYHEWRGAFPAGANPSDRPAANGPRVLYVSPLRSLAADVHSNLEVPLEGIAEEAMRLGLPPLHLDVAMRTGDTSPAQRAAMRRRPPDLLVTTPESLYLLVTAGSSRAMLANVRTVIVDEVHTLARDKRG